MMTSDPDPGKRWRAIVEFYAHFAAMKHWEFLAPMVELAEWLATQPAAAKLYPGTSHEWLTVHLHPGYQPGRPFFAAGVRGDGQFLCKLHESVGCPLHSWVGPLEQARSKFMEFVGRLEAIVPKGPNEASG